MISKKLASYCASLKYEDLPEEVIAYTKLCILDYFASALSGLQRPPIRMIGQLTDEMGGEPQATTVTGKKTSILNAALMNGAASHVTEQDDIHKSSIIHAATVVIPAALAVAEWKKLSGKDLLLSIVAGYEICYRIGEAVSPSHYYYWHNTATCGTFGAAVASAKLLGLSEEEMVHAIGNAGSQAAGLWEFIEDGAMTKQLHTGKAAMNGLMASLLAKKGFTGATRILEGDRGFFKAMSEEYDIDKITNGLGEEYKILENSFKVHASCRHTHAAIDLAVAMAGKQPISVEDIERVEVGAYEVALNITDNPDPVTEYESKFSIQYCTALGLVRGKANLEAFNERDLWNPEIRKVTSKVNAKVDPEIDRAYPEKWGASVKVVMKNGEVIEGKTDYPKGDPENPVTPEDLKNKFFSIATGLPEGTRVKFADHLLNIEEIKDVSDLMNGLSALSLVMK